MSLRLKITLSFILAILLTFSPLLFMMQTKVKSTNMKETEHQTLQLMKSKSNEIGLWLNQRLSEIRIMKDFEPIKNLNFAEVIPYMNNINSNITKYDKNLNETFAVGGLDGHGWITSNFYIDVSRRKYFNEVMNTNKEYVISDPVMSKSDSKPIFLISSPIINDNNEKIGFINGAVSLKRVSDIVHDIDVYNGFSWIMNTGMNVYSTNKDVLNKKYISDKELKLVVDDFQNKKLGSTSVKTEKNKDATVFYSQVPNADDWILCTIVNNEDIHTQTNYLIDLIIKLAILFIVFSIILSAIISGSIVKPIQSLKQNMIDVSNGNLNSYYTEVSNDEISILGKNFNNMLNEIKALIIKTHKIEMLKRTAELKTLQSQINPHFLYNTLDTIQWKALGHKDYEIADMINSLSGFFRISLSNGKEFITIEDEAKHVKYYLDIQKTRYEDTIDYDIKVDDNIKQYYIPKLIIQPLVENSIYHGLKEKPGKGLIEIDISSNKEFLFITVKDNGLGISKEKLEEIKDNLYNSIESEHYGLYNINERLKIFFGDKYDIFIQSNFNIDTTITLKIPILSEGFQCIEQ